MSNAPNAPVPSAGAAAPPATKQQELGAAPPRQAQSQDRPAAQGPRPPSEAPSPARAAAQAQTQPTAGEGLPSVPVHPDAEAPPLLPAPNQSVILWAQENLAGSFGNAEDAAMALRLAAQRCHLVGGAAGCPLIEGHDVLITVVPIDVAGLYPVKEDPTKMGIGKATILQLAAAAGIEWTYSRRQDDGADPLYCHWRVRGRYRMVDGTSRTIEGDRDVDNRDGSPQIAGKTAKFIEGARATTVRNAITKAKLRAVREGFGIPTAMPIADLDKPFVFARSIFTGRSEDLVTRRRFAEGILVQQLAATAALFGTGIVQQIGPRSGPQAPQLQPARRAAGGGMGVFDVDVDVFDIDESEAEAAPAPARPRRVPAPPPARAAAPAPQAPAAQGAGARAQPARQGEGAVHVVRIGRDKGKPITEVDDLRWYAGVMEENADDPSKGNFREANLLILAEVRAEIARRRAQDGG